MAVGALVLVARQRSLARSGARPWSSIAMPRTCPSSWLTPRPWEPLRQCLRTQCPGPLTSLSLTGPALVAPARLSVATIAAAVAACVSLVAALGLLALRLRSGMARDRHPLVVELNATEAEM